ncbi:MAG: MarR family transcriptional regulator [Betaproteobacteria bacterium]|nr:MarR family transcriptional regulator [Betaproteobacteria bacterium]NBY55880.1 MarR family transcriptional regulator [Betaproteobacteria bacterium]NCY05670.1 MarR family transcriptional regulator [Betaproteobacteria bacterium]
MSTSSREKKHVLKLDPSPSTKSAGKRITTPPVVLPKTSSERSKARASTNGRTESKVGRGQRFLGTKDDSALTGGGRSRIADKAATKGQSEHMLAKEVLGQFRSIFAAVRTHFARVEKAVGIGGAQVWALALIEASPGASLGEIASGMDVHQSTASNLVRLLLEAGYIESLRSGDDRRKVELSITAKGRLLLRKAPKPYTGVLPHALAALSAAQLKMLRVSLAAVSDHLNVEPAHAKKPLATM